MVKIFTSKYIKRLIPNTALTVLFSFTVTLYASQFGFAQNTQNIRRISEEGVLKLTTKHRGLTVQIDDVFVGYTPIEIQTLSVGTHKVYISHPDRANWLDKDWLQDVEISANDTTIIEVIFQLSYSINSQPYGASVYLKNEKIGETPTFLTLDEGSIEQVTVSKIGFQDTTFTIGEGSVRFFDITLTREENLNLAMPPDAFKIQRKSKTKLYFFSALGLSIATGALALYFRNKADDNYDRYLKSGDPQAFNKFYDDAKKFDKFAAVSFGTFQVSFIFSFYFFLKGVNN